MIKGFKEVERLLYTVPEAAAVLGIGVTKTRELIRSGELRSVKIGRLRRITVTSLSDYVLMRDLEQSKVPS